MTNPLIGVSRIARRLNISRQRVHALADRGDFPEPAHQFDAGRAWHEDDIERWIARNPQYDHTVPYAPEGDPEFMPATTTRRRP